MIWHGSVQPGQILYVPVGGVLALAFPQSDEPATQFKSCVLPKAQLEKSLEEVAAIKEFAPTAQDNNTLGLIQDAAAAVPQ